MLDAIEHARAQRVKLMVTAQDITKTDATTRYIVQSLLANAELSRNQIYDKTQEGRKAKYLKTKDRTIDGKPKVTESRPTCAILCLMKARSSGT